MYVAKAGLCKLNICVSHQTTQRILKEFGKDSDSVVTGWRSTLQPLIDKVSAQLAMNQNGYTHTYI